MDSIRHQHPSHSMTTVRVRIMEAKEKKLGTSSSEECIHIHIQVKMDRRENPSANQTPCGVSTEPTVVYTRKGHIQVVFVFSLRLLFIHQAVLVTMVSLMLTMVVVMVAVAVAMTTVATCGRCRSPRRSSDDGTIRLNDSERPINNKYR